MITMVLCMCVILSIVEFRCFDLILHSQLSCHARYNKVRTRVIARASISKGDDHFLSGYHYSMQASKSSGDIGEGCVISPLHPYNTSLFHCVAE